MKDNMKDNMKKFLLVMLILLISFSSTGDIYKVYIDREFGFWAVRDITNVSNRINYTDRIININTGDTVIWENADAYDDRVTIVSDNWLWGKQGIALPFGRQHRLTFNSSGTFKFHIVENSRTNFSEITVTEYYYNDPDTGEEITYNITNSGPTTKYFPFHSQTIMVTGPEIGEGTRPNYSVPFGDMATVPDINTTLNSDNWKMFVKAVKDGNITPYREKVEKIKTVKENPVVYEDIIMESYQEFTIYEILKRWFIIIKSGGQH